MHLCAIAWFNFKANISRVYNKYKSVINFKRLCAFSSQAASQSQPVHSEMDQSKLLFKNNINKIVNNSVGKELSHQKLNDIRKLPLTEKDITSHEDVDSIYLRLNGSEAECMFASKALETKSTVNVSYNLVSHK